MYVVYEFLTGLDLRREQVKVKDKRKISEHETLDDANEKLNELNERHKKRFYTIIMEP